MRGRGDSHFLHNCRRAEQRARRHEQDIAVLSPLHSVKDISAQHRRTASAAGASGVHILALVKNHHPAVAVIRPEVDPLLRQKIAQQPRPHAPEVAGEKHIVVPELRPAPDKVAVYGIRRSR